MAKTKKVSTYYGGNLTARQKAAHEKRLSDIYGAAIASNSPLNNAVVPALYRDFVAFCGKQRKPYVTGTERADSRLLSAIGGAGERGEVCNIIKKLMFREKVGSTRVNVRCSSVKWATIFGTSCSC